MMANCEVNKSVITSFEVKDQIGILTIDNGSHNKIKQADFVDLKCLEGWISSNELKGLIITGKGRHFSAGADVDNIKANKDNLDYLKESLRKGREILKFIETLPIVTVAAISGACFGAGLEIALSCQYRICANNAMLAFPESNLGIMPGLSGTIRLTKKVGKAKAIEMIISGKNVVAEEAFQIGLVDKIVPNKEHVAAAISFIEELTQNKSSHQINSILKSINNSYSKAEADAMEEECDLFLELVSETFKEA